MKIQTTRFGEIEVDEALCFEMVLPILGYENESKYVIIEHKENSSFRWLQSMQTPDLAFAVTIAGCFGIDYTFELPDEQQSALGIVAAEEILALNIVVIPHENPKAATINLVAPLVFNLTNRKGGQIILNDPKLRIDYPLLKKEAIC